MAIDNQFGKGIGVAAGFNLGAQKPLDSRVAVNTIAERDAHVENNRAYEGMLVFVDETKLTYQLVNGVWVELLKAEKDRLDVLEAQLNGGEGTEGSGVLAKLQDDIDNVNARLNSNGDIDNRIAQNASDIDALEGLVGKPVEGENPATGLHLALNNVKAELEQDILDEKSRAKGQEAAIRQEMADAIGQHAAEGVVASGLRKEMDEAVAAEKQRAELAEQGLQGAIDAINNTENGILAQAKALDKTDRDAQLLIDQEQNRRLGLLEAANAEDGAVANKIKAAQDAADAAQADVDAIEKRLDDEGGLVDRLEAVEGFKQGHSHEGLQGEIDAVEGRVDALETFKNEHSHDTIEQGIADNKAAIDKLNGAADAEGSVAKAVADAVKAEEDRAKKVEEDHEARIAANEAFVAAQPAKDKAQDDRLAIIEEMMGLGGVEGDKTAIEELQDSIDAVQDNVDALEAVVGKAAVAGDENGEGAQAATGLHKLIADEDARVLDEAKAHAEQKITALVDSAPEAMNTLNELAKAIKDNKDIYDGYIAEHTTAMATMKSDLQKEIDDDVKVVADELTKQKDAEQEDTLAHKIAQEVARAIGVEAAIRQELANEKAALQTEIDADITAESKLRVAEEQRIEKALTDTADAIRREFAAADADLRTTISVEIDADVKVEKERAELAEQGLQAAIEAEVGKEGVQGNRDKAIAAALKSYSTTEEVKTILGNVVNSLALTMENDQVVLKLGGADGIALTSVSLDITTDDEIDAIIAGLDKEE